MTVKINVKYNFRPDDEKIKFGEFARAYAIVYTRYKDDNPDVENLPVWMSDIENEGCGSLAPIFDMLNHSNEPNCDWESDAGAQIITDKPIKKGDELFIRPVFNAFS